MPPRFNPGDQLIATGFDTRESLPISLLTGKPLHEKTRLDRAGNTADWRRHYQPSNSKKSHQQLDIGLWFVQTFSTRTESIPTTQKVNAIKNQAYYDPFLSIGDQQGNALESDGALFNPSAHLLDISELQKSAEITSQSLLVSA